MGHDEGTGISDAARYERAKERERKKVAWEAIVEEVKIIVSDLVQVVTEEECKLLCTEQIEIGLQYVKVSGVASPNLMPGHRLGSPQHASPNYINLIHTYTCPFSYEHQ